MDKQLQRLIDLSNKTGDRLIVFDPSRSENAYVLMPIGDYERFALGNSEVRGLTEEELLDKINRDIAIWKSDRAEENLAGRTESRPSEDFRFDSYQGDDKEEDFFEDEEDFDEEDEDWHRIGNIADRRREMVRESEPPRKGPWRIPSDRKKKAEEIIEEDRFYLEDIDD